MSFANYWGKEKKPLTQASQWRILCQLYFQPDTILMQNARATKKDLLFFLKIISTSPSRTCLLVDLSDKHHNEICSCVPCWPSKIPRGHSIPIRLGTCWTNSKSLSKRSPKTASHSGDCLGNIEIRKCSCPCVTSLRTYLYNSRWLPCSKGYSRLCYAQSPSIWIPNAGKTRPCLTHTHTTILMQMAIWSWTKAISILLELGVGLVLANLWKIWARLVFFLVAAELHISSRGLSSS